MGVDYYQRSFCSQLTPSPANPTPFSIQRGRKHDEKTILVTPDGRFAVLQGTYSQAARSTGKWIYGPAYAVLEFKDSLIVTETWYYDGSMFH